MIVGYVGGPGRGAGPRLTPPPRACLGTSRGAQSRRESPATPNAGAPPGRGSKKTKVPRITWFSGMWESRVGGCQKYHSQGHVTSGAAAMPRQAWATQTRPRQDIYLPWKTWVICRKKRDQGVRRLGIPRWGLSDPPSRVSHPRAPTEAGPGSKAPPQQQYYLRPVSVGNRQLAALTRRTPTPSRLLGLPGFQWGCARLYPEAAGDSPQATIQM